MYICLCNGLREKDIDAAIAEGAVNHSEVYQALGCNPKCGMCVPEVEERLVSHVISGAASATGPRKHS